MLARSRWVGPGPAMAQRHNTVYVAMRARLWKRAADQCRPATAGEALGAQLLSEASLAALR
eukprot:8990160-Alexandrium_andersonii.AAC.1